MSIKQLKGRITLQGNGLVNFQGNTPTTSQYKRFYSHIVHNGSVSKNCSFAKEFVYKDKKLNENGEYEQTENVRKIIDSNLLRKEILGSENEVITSLLSDDKDLRLRYISQPNMIVRGWMYTLEKAKNRQTENAVETTQEDVKTEDSSEKGIIIKRTSGVCITSAIQTCGAQTFMSVRTRSGKKDSNSLFYREMCGEIKYESDVIFDVKGIQFISLDDNYDRMSFFESEAGQYIENLKKHGLDATKGRFRTHHLNEVGEQGLVLTKESVYSCIRETIGRILDLNIVKSGSYAKLDKFFLEVGGKEVEIKTLKDFDDLKLEFDGGFENLNVI